MGTPLPGDFPDAINLKSDQVLLKANQEGNAGDYVIADYTQDPVDWGVVGVGTVGNGLSVRGAIYQLQQYVSSLNQAANIVPAGVFGIGSWLYGYAVDDIKPLQYCVLYRLGAVFGFSPYKKIAASAADVTGNVLTVSTTLAHNLHAGDKVTLSGMTPAGLDGEVTIATITDSDTFTAAKTLANTAGTEFGTVDKVVDARDSHVQLVKKVGATYSQGAKSGDVCEFSMVLGGNAQ